VALRVRTSTIFRSIFEFLLVHHPKTLFFVNHNQTQIFEPNIVLKQPMVPMTMSTVPAIKSLMTPNCACRVRKP